MTIISDEDLQAFSDLATELALKDMCDVLRETRTPDGQGGTEITWTVVATVPCALIDSGQSPQEVVIAERLQGKTLKRLLVPRLTDIRGADRLRINGITYKVIDLYDPTSYEVLRRVAVEQLA
uniref:Head-tail adaptor protein n=1 Tax=Thermosporothrix sp. COM3 TaxID=2490863 RepID=A0A455SRF5_9CHLR|nr:hypothetical protein KTC_48920 [Thermosporothrix sp. COM3]BBH90206.1 hypothetical protein KTC_49570 [Thermosporothrix sp. COM3]BBH90271.1 hypothetical protein KTC_50220 [Thermosporothrix sp. COM3]